MAEDCVFCRIIRGELPSWKVYEDDDVVAFLDINPVTKGHTLVVPKQHYRNIFDAPDDVLAKVIAAAKKVAWALRRGLGAEGVHIVSNAEPAAKQVVFHFHVHVIPRWSNDGAELRWSRTKYSSDSEADEIAEKIRKAAES